MASLPELSPAAKKAPEALVIAGDLPELSPTSKEFKESFAQRRKSSQLLSPLKVRQPASGTTTVDGNENREEVEEEGVLLFNYFVEKELERNGIQETEIIEVAVSSATIQSKQTTPMVNVSSFQFESVSVSSGMHSNGTSVPSSQKHSLYKHPKWAKKGSDLRKLADAFATSPERQKVKEKAKEVWLNEHITAAMFWDMMSELFFQGHVTRERIVVLFCFCSDVAIFALQENSVDYFHRFMVWALQYIRNRVCTWVANNGGWDNVLSVSVLPMVTKVAAAVLAGYVTYKLGKAVYNSITM